MVIRTFFDKNNTLVYNTKINTGLNPVSELFYGGDTASQSYSRFIFYFDEARLKSLYTGGTYTDLTKLKHTLRMTNTGAFDKELLGKPFCFGKERTGSFDLVLFPVDENWDEGYGYDYASCTFIGGGETSQSFDPSNWLWARTNTEWPGGYGIYSGSPTVLATQHFDKGNENLEMDITDIVNGYITGDTNNGLGIAFTRVLEETPTTEHQYVGFFTRHTQSFYEPYVETIYDCHIKDDRTDFYLDKDNKLYLYVNLNGNPTNLDTIPSATILDNNGTPFSSYTPSDVTHVTKGVYSIDINVPTTANYSDCILFNDIWSGLVINGVSRPDIELDFALKDSMGYYNIGDSDELPKKVGINVTGIKRDEEIHRGDIRKVIVSTRIPYTVEQKQTVDSLKYRLYVKEGKNQYTVIDFQDVEITNNNNYFLLDTASLVPNTYYLDVKVESNLEVNTIAEVLSFDIVSQSDLRISQ
jgi:hypothetical protein